jgi:hypothetical protein
VGVWIPARCNNQVTSFGCTCHLRLDILKAVHLVVLLLGSYKLFWGTYILPTPSEDRSNTFLQIVDSHKTTCHHNPDNHNWYTSVSLNRTTPNNRCNDQMCSLWFCKQSNNLQIL